MASPNPTKLTISINPKPGSKPTVGKPNQGANSGVEISISGQNNEKKSVSLDLAEIEKNKGNFGRFRFMRQKEGVFGKLRTQWAE